MELKLPEEIRMDTSYDELYVIENDWLVWADSVGIYRRLADIVLYLGDDVTFKQPYGWNIMPVLEVIKRDKFSVTVVTLAFRIGEHIKGNEYDRYFALTVTSNDLTVCRVHLRENRPVQVATFVYGKWIALLLKLEEQATAIKDKNAVINAEQQQQVKLRQMLAGQEV